jgi:hypothetical protein
MESVRISASGLAPDEPGKPFWRAAVKLDERQEDGQRDQYQYPNEVRWVRKDNYQCCDDPCGHKTAKDEACEYTYRD